MDRNKLVGFWAFGGVLFISFLVMVVLVVGMWGLSKIFLDPFTETQEGTSLLQIYRKMPTDAERVARIENFARAHRPSFEFVSTKAAPQLCQEWLGYIKRNFDTASGILAEFAPDPSGGDIYAIIDSLPEDAFIRFQAYSSAGTNLLRTYILQCGG